MTDKEKLEEIEAYYKEVGNVVESEWIWLIETLKKYMDVFNEILDIDLGIYPQAFVGKYKKRTLYMDGWNAHNIKHCEEREKICQKYNIHL